ncbi:MAG: DUF4340 domain-containing protein [Fidelibacterota bacterium]
MTKQWKIILIAIAGLSAIYVINISNQGKHTTSAVEIFPVKPDDISSFVITEGDQTIELTRKDTLWEITGNDSLNVKKFTIKNFLTKSLNVKRETMISKNPEKWNTYSVDDSNGVRLELFDQNGSEIGSAIFGRSKSEWSKNFVRVGNDKEVFQTNENILYQLQTRPNYWGEKPKPPEPDSTSTE